MIFYFSGTGNSRFIAKRIQEKTGDEMYSLNEAIKQKKFFSGKTPETAVFVVPAYAWRIPEIVETWIRKSKFDIGMKAYFVMTCGDGIGNAAKYARKLCEDKVFIYMGCAGILMPENYLAMFRVPSEEEAKISLQMRSRRSGRLKSRYLQEILLQKNRSVCLELCAAAP